VTLGSGVCGEESGKLVRDAVDAADQEVDRTHASVGDTEVEEEVGGGGVVAGAAEQSLDSAR
jgi:hypothetical protein